jgi:hypothetical protein
MTAVVPAPFQTYFRLNDGQALDNSFAFPTVASEDLITAATTQTQVAAYQLTAPLSRVTTVATAANGVAMPPAYVGKQYWVINDGANAMQVYGNNTLADTINSVATATGISQPAGTIFHYTCTTAGNWVTKQVSDTFTNLTVNGVLTLGGSSVGTWTANGTTPVVIANTNVTTNSLVIPSLNTASGTVGAIPHVSALTASTSFSMVASAADTSIYNYGIVQA